MPTATKKAPAKKTVAKKAPAKKVATASSKAKTPSKRSASSPAAKATSAKKTAPRKTTARAATATKKDGKTLRVAVSNQQLAKLNNLASNMGYSVEEYLLFKAIGTEPQR